MAVDDATVEQAAEAIAAADGMLVGAGAGMGVDSGLPDFRGDQGFWKAYPPYARLGLSFIDMANPQGFADDPELAWGFYGHRLNLYRDTVPHQGFAILQRWAQRMIHGLFVFTSNVDGFKHVLNKLDADGGGDTPEDLQSGLDKAMHELDWRPDALRLGFVVSDAIPHTDYGQQYNYRSAMREGLQRGIKWTTVGSIG